MRLLNADTLALELFPDPVPETVSYAILSHTWELEEVTFADMQDLVVASTKLGFDKIQLACQEALVRGYKYIWIDTCCIDKSSSGELSEAINSMFQWYQGSALCLTFLVDFPSDGKIDQHLQLCRWFTRGWTLQELIASKDVLFFDQRWNLIGTKATLGREIETITGISSLILNGSIPLASVPLARRMSWAAERKTTREEDQAYCLLGIFNVSMPMIYGEKSRAFIRLQEEILRRTSDLSIFAWQSNNTDTQQYRGILAQSPAEFACCAQIELNDDQFRFREEINLTNRGVRIKTPLQYLGSDTYVMDLHCSSISAPNLFQRLGIYLRRAQDTYLRSSPHEIARAEPAGPRTSLPRPIYLMSTTDDRISHPLLDSGTASRFIEIDLPSNSTDFRIHSVKAVPETYWEAHDRRFSIGTLRDFVCFVRFSITSIVTTMGYQQSEETTPFLLVCDLGSGNPPRLCLYAQSGLQSTLRSERFIDPFTNIEDYGPLGDAFSLDNLRPGGSHGLRSVTMVSPNLNHNYVVTATYAGLTPPVFRARVSISRGGTNAQADMPPLPPDRDLDPSGGRYMLEIDVSAPPPTRRF
ncbi:hypothetical protein OQA88_1151 [Cercophora sp. LCS_1]